MRVALALFLALQRIFTKDVFNPNGPEYEGVSGQYTYAIFASVSVTHSKARDLCRIYYTDGSLAWLGDFENPSIRAVADQALVFHYMNGNNYFWIDGILDDPICPPDNMSCLWVASSQTWMPYFAYKSFYTQDTACHTPKDDLSGENAADRLYWPVLLPNANAELGKEEPFLVAAAPGYARGGFICVHGRGFNQCPFGFTATAEVPIPEDLKPRKTSSADLCLQ